VAPGSRHVEVYRRGIFRQSWRARFIADNGVKLARTAGFHHNLGDLKAMLANYFPDWEVVVIGRAKK
jgi:hypothetical protein